MPVDIEKRNKRQNTWILKNKERINFMMEKGTKLQIKEAATKAGIKSSEWIRRAIKEKLERDKSYK